MTNERAIYRSHTFLLRPLCSASAVVVNFETQPQMMFIHTANVFVIRTNLVKVRASSLTLLWAEINGLLITVKEHAG